MQTLLRNVLLGGGGGYSPASLFAGGVVGAFYDPSDLSTLYQDSAGTTPVTGVEQVVGLMLDKSQGLVLGSELVTNGDFSGGTTGWSATNSTLSASNNQLTVTSTANFGIGASTGFTTVIGRTYKATARLISCSSATARIRKTDSPTNFNSSAVHLINDIVWTPGQTFTVYFQATATITYIMAVTDTNPSNITIAAVSVRELPGNHATSTGSARPTLSARVNLLTYSEEFQNAAWTKPSGAVSVNQNAVGPNGVPNSAATLTAGAGTGNHWLYQSFAASATTYICSVYAKAGTANWIGLGFGAGVTLDGVFFDLSSGTIGTSAFGSTGTIQDVGNGWYRCVVTRTLLSGTAFGALEIHTANNQALNWSAVGTETILIWGADLRPTNIGVNIPSYQRIAAATNYDTNGFPFYLSFGGAQSMSTPANLDLTSTDKVTVFAGVRKLSDAAVGVVGESSANSASNNGTFLMYAPANSASPDYGWRSGGTTRQTLAPVTYAAPITNALTGIGDISAPEVTLRINGVQAATSSNTQGTGNFGTYPLYIGARAGSSLFFTGYLYSLIIQGAAASATQLASTEAWVNQKTKAY